MYGSQLLQGCIREYTDLQGVHVYTILPHIAANCKKKGRADARPFGADYKPNYLSSQLILLLAILLLKTISIPEILSLETENEKNISSLEIK